jgi:DNA repair exonuclease SbcCD ATPase subunit
VCRAPFSDFTVRGPRNPDIAQTFLRRTTPAEEAETKESNQPESAARAGYRTPRPYALVPAPDTFVTAEVAPSHRPDSDDVRLEIDGNNSVSALSALADELMRDWNSFERHLQEMRICEGQRKREEEIKELNELEMRKLKEEMRKSDEIKRRIDEELCKAQRELEELEEERKRVERVRRIAELKKIRTEEEEESKKLEENGERKEYSNLSCFTFLITAFVCFWVMVASDEGSDTHSVSRALFYIGLALWLFFWCFYINESAKLEERKERIAQLHVAQSDFRDVMMFE